MKAEDDPEVSHEPDAEIEPVVREMEFVPASFIVTPETTIEDAVPIRLPPPEIARLAPPVMLFPDVVSLPVTDSVPRTSSAVFCVTVPETTKLLNPLVASRVATLADVPDILTVLVPRANVEPAPDVSHCPLRTGMLHRGIRRLRDSQKSTFAKRGNRRSRRRFLRPSSSRCCC